MGRNISCLQFLENWSYISGLSSPLGTEVPMHFVPQSTDESMSANQVLTQFEDNISGTRDGFSNIVLATGTPDYRESDSLAHYLSRPLIIGNYNLATQDATNINTSVFFQDKRIANRLSTFRNMQADLCLKFVVNGNPFMYGRYIAGAYLQSENIFQLNALSPYALSQTNHIYLDVSNSVGGMLRIPYSLHKEAFNLVSNSVTPNLAKIYLAPIIKATALTNTAPVTLTVFMWLENVVLSAPTDFDSAGYTPQSTDDIPPVYMRQNVNFSNVENSDASYRLTFHKSSLVNDLTGISSPDKKTVLDIAKTMGHFANFEWKQSDVVGKVLGSVSVNPRKYSVLVNTTPTAYNTVLMTPLYYASLPFNYWRGSIKVKLSCICSAMHRGRLRVNFDPNSFKSGSSSVVSNTTNQFVWDLAEHNEVTMVVPYMNDHSFLNIPPNSSDSVNSGFSTSLLINDALSNGALSFSVANPLSSPAVSSTVTIMISVCAGDDYLLADPTDHLIQDWEFTPQAIDEDVVTNDSVITLGQTTSVDDSLFFKTYFGDCEMDLTKMLARYVLAMFVPLPASRLFTTAGAETYGFDNFAYLEMPAFPLPRKRSDDSGDALYNTDTSGVKFNFVNNHPMFWYSKCFSGRKGGVKVRLIDETRGRSWINFIKVSRTSTETYRLAALPIVNSGNLATAIQIRTISPPTSISVGSSVGMGFPYYNQNTPTPPLDPTPTTPKLTLPNPTGWSGTTLVNASNPGLIPIDFTVPYHTFKRYIQTRNLDYAEDETDPGFHCALGYQNINPGNQTISSPSVLGVYMAAGDDFTLHHFVGVPYLRLTPATALWPVFRTGQTPP
jgi:hypothetical protein